MSNLNKANETDVVVFIELDSEQITMLGMKQHTLVSFSVAMDMHLVQILSAFVSEILLYVLNCSL